MKTLEELLEETEQLQSMATLVANLHGEISEIIHAKEKQGKDVDFASILRAAERHPITPHPLDGKDAHAVESYLTLLLSVAAHGTSSDAKDNPLVYPCRIAAVLRPAPDMELLFKRSLILDEKAVNEAVAAVEREQLVDFFVLDALRLIELYDHGNLQKLEYVSDLAALMNVSKERMNDLLTIFHLWMQKDKKFVGIFSEIDFTPFFSYLSVSEYAVRTPNEIIVQNEGGLQEEEILNILNYAPIKDKKMVGLLNVHFHVRATAKAMKFSNVKTLKIWDSTFENYADGVFDVENCQTFEIINSQFKDCTKQIGSSDWGSTGIIGNLKDVANFHVASCSFNECFLYWQAIIGVLEERSNSRLFRGVKAKTIDHCQLHNSSPVC